jgi:hypothetical protein
MARLAEVMLDEGREHVGSLGIGPSRIGEALRLAIAQAENDAGNATERDDEISRAMEHIRKASAFRQSAESRVRDLEAALEAARDDAHRDLNAANHRAGQAEARAAAEAERADSAERRLHIVEDWLDQVMAVIESELMPRTGQDQLEANGR